MVTTMKTNSVRKKLSLILAVCVSLTMLAGCGKKIDDDEELSTNIITQDTLTSEDASDVTDGGSADVTSVLEGDAPEITAEVTDDSGNIVTGDDGAAVTQIVTAPQEAATQPTGTLSEDDIMNAITAKPAEATTVVAGAKNDNVTNYAYESLTADEKALYDVIVDSASTMHFKIRGTDNLSLEEWSKVLGMVYNQEPQLFWLNKKIKKGKLFFNETDSDKIAKMQQEIDSAVSKIMAEADKKSSDFDKLKVFHDHLVLNSTFQKNDDVYGWNQTIYNAFVNSDGQSDIQCSGYAKAMLYLCNKAGIPCMVITGTNDQKASHAWNKVKVDGKWYNLDCTWDDPILSVADHEYLRYNYFLVPDSWINEKTHFNVNKFFLDNDSTIKYFDPPAATDDAANYFVKNGFVYSDASSAEKALKAQIDAAIFSGNPVVQIRVSSASVYKELTAKGKDFQTYARDKSSSVKGIADNCNENMLLIEYDVKFN